MPSAVLQENFFLYGNCDRGNVLLLFFAMFSGHVAVESAAADVLAQEHLSTLSSSKINLWENKNSLVYFLTNYVRKLLEPRNIFVC